MNAYTDKLEQWRARRRAIVEHYKKSNSLRETGEAFGISGERVRQIVATMEGKDASLPADREILGGNGLHGEGHPTED